MLLAAGGSRDLLWAAVVTGGLTLIGVIVTGFLSRSNQKMSKSIADQVLEELNTGNDHTAGQSLNRIEERQFMTEQKVDRLDMHMSESNAVMQEHLETTAPLIEWVGEQIQADSEEG